MRIKVVSSTPGQLVDVKVALLPPGPHWVRVLLQSEVEGLSLSSASSSDTSLTSSSAVSVAAAASSSSAPPR